MALVIKSNVQYAGTDVLLNVADVTYSASEFYTKYAAAVTADGGRIVDAAATLAAIQWAKDNGVLGKVSAVGAPFGVNDSGGDAVRLYGLNGEILDLVGTGVTVNEAGAFPFLDWGGAGPYYKTIAAKKHVTSKSVGMFVSTDDSLSGSFGWQCAVTDGVETTQSDIFIIRDEGGNPNFNVEQVATTALSQAQSPWQAYSASGGIADTEQNYITSYLDGVEGVTKSTTDGNELIDVKSAANHLMLGKRLVSGSPYGSPTGSKVTEFWLINDCTPAIARSITQRMADLYTA